MTNLIYDSLAALEPAFKVLELLPDTHAWVKDCEGCFVRGNGLFYRRFSFSNMEELTGKTDFDLAPQDLARQYRADDDQVLRGITVTDRLELIGGAAAVEWFLTSKWPIYNGAGEVIGSLGISRHLNRAEAKTIPFQELSAPIHYIQVHFAERISIASLAAACNLSVSALERRFRKHLDKTPHQYITEMRLEHSRRLLSNSDKAIGTIALETGFSDHSHFTRAFRRHYGIAPSEAR